LECLALEKKGYKIEVKEFSDHVQPNIALANKSIDVMSSSIQVYLEGNLPETEILKYRQ